jgi:hypothetical protein
MGWVDGWMGWGVDGWKGWVDGWMNGLGGWMDEWVGWVGVWMDGLGGWMDGRMDIYRLQCLNLLKYLSPISKEILTNIILYSFLSEVVIYSVV